MQTFPVVGSSLSIHITLFRLNILWHDKKGKMGVGGQGGGD